MNRLLPVELPEGYIDFYKDLESWQNEQEISLKKYYKFEKFDILSLLAANKKPLLQITGLKIQTEKYKELFLSLLNLIGRLRPDTAKVIDSIAEYTDSLNFDIIIEKIIADDADYLVKLAADIGVTEELFLFILDHSLRPFLKAYASPYQEDLINDEFQSWDLPAICPVCGARPHVSRLRAADGRRFMFCDRCFTEWETKYLVCVHCGNNEPGSIKYITVENDDAYQIYTCEKCKGYLKTYDERQTGRSTDLYIANIETIYLDMVAQEKGYTNHDI